MYSPLPQGLWARVLQVKGFRRHPAIHQQVQKRSRDETNTSHVHLPGKRELVIEMTGLNLDNRAADYDALSYTWGYPISTPECQKDYSAAHDVRITITVEGSAHEVAITRNLYEALTALYNMNHKRYLWVDALCIDQNNVEEKSRQVLMMGEIYSKAHQVIVWLGLDDPDDPTLEQIVYLHTVILDRIEAYEKTNDDELSHTDIRPMHYGENQGLGIAKLDTIIPWEAVHALFRFYRRRRYLGRAWIRQELVLAKEDPLILIGDQFITFGRLRKLNSLFNGHPMLLSFVQDATEGENEGLGHELTWIPERSSVKSFFDQVSDHTFGVVDGAPNRIYAVWEQLMTEVSQSKSTDPRDMIYSLEGLAKHICGDADHEIVVRPDYQAPVEEVYTEFTAALLQNSPYGHVLSLAHHCGRQTQIKDGIGFRSRLPSWVPDYTSCRDGVDTFQMMYCRQLNRSPAFSPAGSRPSNIPILRIHANRLHLTGRCAGTITQTSKLVSPDLATQKFPNEILRSMAYGLRENLFLLQTALAQGPIYPNGSSTYESLIRLFADILPSEQDTHTLEFRTRTNLSTASMGLFALAHDESTIMADYAAQMACIKELQGSWAIPTLEEMTYSERLGSGIALFTETNDRSLMDQFPRSERDRLADAQSDFFVYRGVTETSFFVMQNGYMGKTFSVPEVGDEVWLFYEMNVPFILRPAEGGTYQLVGETFVQGGIFGELVERGIAGEVRQVVIV